MFPNSEEIKAPWAASETDNMSLLILITVMCVIRTSIDKIQPVRIWHIFTNSVIIMGVWLKNCILRLHTHLTLRQKHWYWHWRQRKADPFYLSPLMLWVMSDAAGTPFLLNITSKILTSTSWSSTWNRRKDFSSNRMTATEQTLQIYLCVSS